MVAELEGRFGCCHQQRKKVAHLDLLVKFDEIFRPTCCGPSYTQLSLPKMFMKVFELTGEVDDGVPRTVHSVVSANVNPDFNCQHPT